VAAKLRRRRCLSKQNYFYASHKPACEPQWFTGQVCMLLKTSSLSSKLRKELSVPPSHLSFLRSCIRSGWASLSTRLGLNSPAVALNFYWNCISGLVSREHVSSSYPWSLPSQRTARISSPCCNLRPLRESRFECCDHELSSVSKSSAMPVKRVARSVRVRRRPK